MPINARAAVCREFGKPLTIETVTLQEPKGSEILVDILACAICFSDLHFLDGHWGGALPAIYGHEGIGKIAAMGERVDGLSIGDTVLVTLLRSCGCCNSCYQSKPGLCSSSYDRMSGLISDSQGNPIEHGLATGAFAEKVVVDVSQTVRVPGTLPPEALCLLSCGVITGVGAVVNTASLRPGQTAAVIGAGGVGLNAIQAAHISGASKIIAIDLMQEKLNGAMTFGATHGVIGDADVVETVRGITNGDGVDYVFVTVGSTAVYDMAWDYLAPGGTVVAVGLPHAGASAKYEPLAVGGAGHSLVGSLMGDTVLGRDIPWMIQLYLQGRLKLDELVSKCWPLEQINEAIVDTRSGAARRNVIIF